MTIASITITNPGAESGTTGWNATTGTLTTDTNIKHTGSSAFWLPDFFPSDTKYGQTLAVPPAYEAAVDAETAAIRTAVWIHSGNASDVAAFYVEFYESDGTTLISDEVNPYRANQGWTEDEIFIRVPADTRFIRIGCYCDSLGATYACRQDDYQLEISDDYLNDYPAVFALVASQIGQYVIGTFPSEEIRESQGGYVAVSASEGDSGLFIVEASQLGAYALVKRHGDSRQLRAWTFKQDDHEFYGLQLGSIGTYIYDNSTEQWAQWTSPDYAYWRAEDVTDWEGLNLACDPLTGKIFEIDAEGRLDYGTTPIRSVVTGYLTHRFRTQAPCYMAELAVSEGQPPTGFDEGEVTITLRTSDDNGQNYINHGSVLGEGLSEDITVRWYGLGVMKAPGRLFEIVDTGYARRIDALDIEVGGQ